MSLKKKVLNKEYACSGCSLLAFEWVGIDPKSQIVYCFSCWPCRSLHQGTPNGGWQPCRSAAAGLIALKGIFAAVWCGHTFQSWEMGGIHWAAWGHTSLLTLAAHAPIAEWGARMSKGLGSSKGLNFGNVSVSCSCNFLLFCVSSCYKFPELIWHF